ncbi:MAG TPA: hypothetical protein VK835_14975 [Bacteroidia bacterium]|jgi:hypothetical protein|nr:hypothetical protein [Bacteroidia bacterium]
MSTKTTSFYLMHRGEKTQWLRKNHPFAFLLLTVIAERIKWNENYNKLNLQLFQCVIGTTEKLWKGCTRMQLRTAIQTLKSNHQITTKTTNLGTVVTLISSDVITIRTSTVTNDLTKNQPTESQKSTTNLEHTRTLEGISLPLYFSDNDVIHALAIELKKTDDSIKNLATAFVKHCGFLKTTYSNNAAFALQRDFKNYVTQQQQTNNNPYKVPYGVLYSK